MSSFEEVGEGQEVVLLPRKRVRDSFGMIAARNAPDSIEWEGKK